MLWINVSSRSLTQVHSFSATGCFRVTPILSAAVIFRHYDQAGIDEKREVQPFVSGCNDNQDTKDHKPVQVKEEVKDHGLKGEASSEEELDKKNTKGATGDLKQEVDVKENCSPKANLLLMAGVFDIWKEEVQCNSK